MVVEWYSTQKLWVLETGQLSSTYAIGVSFVFLAYFLHPAVEDAFKRVRAYRGWCAVENSETVEVTKYPLVSEVFAGRGSWDAARLVAVLLAAFSLASWGLELSLGIAHVDDDVTDLFLRPPPVWTNEANGWNVISRDMWKEIQAFDNIFGSASIGYANARYEVNYDTDKINGAVRVATWNTGLDGLAATLSYGNGSKTALVESATCSGDTLELFVEGEDDKWGTVNTCKEGPGKKNCSDHTPPVLIMKSTKGGAYYMIVEESITYPSFLYSVWTISNDIDDQTVLDHVFHISSSARLAEAVVTEIVHASSIDEEPTGRGSFALLRGFSENNTNYDIDLTLRASPFGEHPMGERPSSISLSAVESIEEGVQLDTTALCCTVWILALTLVGVGWSLLLRSRIGMDIYDRDELIRIVTLQASADDVGHSCKMRIFVRKEEGGNLSVVVNDEKHQSSCPRIFTKKQNTVAINDPVPKSLPNHAFDFGGVIQPARPRTVWLEGVRMGNGKALPGRKGNYHYPTSIALIASPVPSRCGSTVGTPLSFTASPSDKHPPNKRFSALFESVNSLGKSEEHFDDVETDRVGGNNRERHPDAYRERVTLSLSKCECHKREESCARDQRGQMFPSESTATVKDHFPASPTEGPMIRPTLKPSERLRWLKANADRVTHNCSNYHSEAEEENNTKQGIAHNRGDELV